MGSKSRNTSRADERWPEIREVWVCPVYSRRNHLPVEGCPASVLAVSIKDTFEQARMRWPTADGWNILGLADPEDRECILVGSVKASQRLTNWIA